MKFRERSWWLNSVPDSAGLMLLLCSFPSNKRHRKVQRRRCVPTDNSRMKMQARVRISCSRIQSHLIWITRWSGDNRNVDVRLSIIIPIHDMRAYVEPAEGSKIRYRWDWAAGNEQASLRQKLKCSVAAPAGPGRQRAGIKGSGRPPTTLQKWDDSEKGEVLDCNRHVLSEIGLTISNEEC